MPAIYEWAKSHKAALAGGGVGTIVALVYLEHRKSSAASAAAQASLTPNVLGAWPQDLGITPMGVTPASGGVSGTIVGGSSAPTPAPGQAAGPPQSPAPQSDTAAQSQAAPAPAMGPPAQPFAQTAPGVNNNPPPGSWSASPTGNVFARRSLGNFTGERPAA